MIRLVALLYLLKHLAQMLKYSAAFSGSSLAKFGAIRRASSAFEDQFAPAQPYPRG
jgi:formate hydrogenlyase subunit 4